MELVAYPDKQAWKSLLKRPEADSKAMEAFMEEVFSAVRDRGDEAVLAYTQKFDKAAPTAIGMELADLKKRASEIPAPLQEAIDLAYENIRAFHRAQRTPAVAVETRPGVQCWQAKHPISKVGIYIPGGSAPLFSTVLMLAIPAQLAGCGEIVLCSPPDRDGQLHPAICYAALKCGVTRVCRAGGAQAIAALTCGTDSIPAVFKIFGPGNQYVTQAKQWATRLGVAIDMPAGPSELLVVADHTANPAYVAADLLSQAEHGPDSQVMLLTDTQGFAGLVQDALQSQIESLPRREIARQALANSRAIVLSGREEIAEMVNAYAPEHLILCHGEEAYFLEHLRNAGSVFLGNYTPESAGDYASGTNHTLPTNGYARQYSGVNLDSYLKSITYQRITAQGLQQIGPAIEVMAAAEGLEAHKRAVSVRLATLSAQTE